MTRPPVLYAFSIERHTPLAQSLRLKHPTLRPLNSHCACAAAHHHSPTQDLAAEPTLDSLHTQYSLSTQDSLSAQIMHGTVTNGRVWHLEVWHASTGRPRGGIMVLTHPSFASSAFILLGHRALPLRLASRTFNDRNGVGMWDDVTSRSPIRSLFQHQPLACS
jgi:hypothetical protein